MILRILYIIVTILSLSITSVGAKTPSSTALEYKGITNVKFSDATGQLDISMRSNMRQKLTLVEATFEANDDACRATLLEPVVIEPRADQILKLRFSYTAKPLEILNLLNAPSINVKLHAKVKIGNAKRARSFRYQMDVPIDEVKKRMKF